MKRMFWSIVVLAAAGPAIAGDDEEPQLCYETVGCVRTARSPKATRRSSAATSSGPCATASTRCAATASRPTAARRSSAPRPASTTTRRRCRSTITSAPTCSSSRASRSAAAAERASVGPRRSDAVEIPGNRFRIRLTAPHERRLHSAFRSSSIALLHSPPRQSRPTPRGDGLNRGRWTMKKIVLAAAAALVATTSRRVGRQHR